MIIWSVGGIDRGSGMSKGMMKIRSVGYSVEERDDALWAGRAVGRSPGLLKRVSSLVIKLVGWSVNRLGDQWIYDEGAQMNLVGRKFSWRDSWCLKVSPSAGLLEGSFIMDHQDGWSVGRSVCHSCYFRMAIKHWMFQNADKTSFKMLIKHRFRMLIKHCFRMLIKHRFRMLIRHRFRMLIKHRFRMLITDCFRMLMKYRAEKTARLYDVAFSRTLYWPPDIKFLYRVNAWRGEGEQIF